jgi:hypothetical protein
MSLLAELRRRNVIRMAGLYLVGAWLATQVAGTLLPIFHTPEWVLQTLVLLLAIGFLPALVFAWVFELTPEGIKRDAEVKPEESIAPQTARRMDRMIIAVLAVALLYFAVDKFVLAPARQAAAADAATHVAPAVPPAAKTPAISAKSIAVLAFTDLSPQHDQEYFSDGIAEEDPQRARAREGPEGRRPHLGLLLQGPQRGPAHDRQDPGRGPRARRFGAYAG